MRNPRLGVKYDQSGYDFCINFDFPLYCNGE